MSTAAAQYRFTLVCPSCGKTSETVADNRNNPRLKCGDCLMDRTEVVEMKIAKVEIA
jgi:transposase-like protein